MDTDSGDETSNNAPPPSPLPPLMQKTTRKEIVLPTVVDTSKWELPEPKLSCLVIKEPPKATTKLEVEEPKTPKSSHKVVEKKKHETSKAMKTNAVVPEPKKTKLSAELEEMFFESSSEEDEETTDEFLEHYAVDDSSDDVIYTLIKKLPHVVKTIQQDIENIHQAKKNALELSDFVCAPVQPYRDRTRLIAEIQEEVVKQYDMIISDIIASSHCLTRLKWSATKLETIVFDKKTGFQQQKQGSRRYICASVVPVVITALSLYLFNYTF